MSVVGMGILVQRFQLTLPSNISTLGFVMMLNTSVPCLLAAICFYKSGDPYVAFKMN